LVFLSTLPHCGHGSGPSVNKRSIQDSHLQDGLVVWLVYSPRRKA
jgi:hypothetical protein